MNVTRSVTVGFSDNHQETFYAWGPVGGIDDFTYEVSEAIAFFAGVSVLRGGDVLEYCPDEIVSVIGLDADGTSH